MRNIELSKSSLLAVTASLEAADAVSGRQWVMPPTYPGQREGAVHNHTPIRPDGSCERIVIDSPQSVANRMEAKLAEVAVLPRIRVLFGGKEGGAPGHWLDTLALPHRVFDAILRDAEDADGTPFRDTPLGKSITDPKVLMRQSPNVLLFGGWDSHGAAGGGGKKFATAMTVQIWGENAVLGLDAGSRMDPLGITLDAAVIYEAQDGGWTLDETKAARDDKGQPRTKRPSEVGHGNIAPTLVEKGALVDTITLTGAISLSRLRRYGLSADELEVLVAMGVYGLMAVLSDGLDLRSGCELWAKDVRWRVCHGIGRQTDVTLTLEEARASLEDALRRAGIAATSHPTFKASAKLEALLDGTAKAATPAAGGKRRK